MGGSATDANVDRSFRTGSDGCCVQQTTQPIKKNKEEEGGGRKKIMQMTKLSLPTRVGYWMEGRMEGKNYYFSSYSIFSFE